MYVGGGAAAYWWRGLLEMRALYVDIHQLDRAAQAFITQKLSHAVPNGHENCMGMPHFQCWMHGKMLCVAKRFDMNIATGIVIPFRRHPAQYCTRAFGPKPPHEPS